MHLMHSEFTMLNSQFLEAVESNETICIFRHYNPDGDALGSQVGLARWIKLNWPDKKVLMLGEDAHNFTIYDPMDQVENLGTFLSIVLDSATQARVDDQRFITGETIIKIDHHIEVDLYGDLQIVDVQSGSTCEILASMLLSFDHLTMNESVANALLSGILTDTQKFSIESTTAETLRVAASLMDAGANITALNQALFSQPFEIWERRRALQNEVVFKDALAYAIIDQENLNAMNLLDRQAKVFVNMMAGIEEYNIWAIFTQDEEGFFNGSLRSRTHTINEIAAKYNGGGHRLACGTNKLTRETMQELIDELAQLSLSETN